MPSVREGAFVLAALAVLTLASLGCTRGGAPCNPGADAPMIPFAKGTITGDVTYLLGHRTTTQGLASADQSAATFCQTSLSGTPSAQEIVLDCMDRTDLTGTAPWMRLTLGPWDLRQIAVGTTQTDARIETSTAQGDQCLTTAHAALVMTRSDGASAAGPTYVTPDFVRDGNVTSSVDGTTATWSAGYESVCKPPSFTLTLTMSLHQAASDYGEAPDPTPCALDISK